MNFKSKILKVLCAIVIMVVSRCNAFGDAGSICGHCIFKNKETGARIVMFGTRHDDIESHKQQGKFLENILLDPATSAVFLEAMSLNDEEVRHDEELRELRRQYEEDPSLLLRNFCGFSIIPSHVIQSEGFFSKIENIDKRSTKFGRYVTSFIKFPLLSTTRDWCKESDSTLFDIAERFTGLAENLEQDCHLPDVIKKSFKRYLENFSWVTKDCWKRRCLFAIPTPIIRNTVEFQVIFNVANTLLDLEMARRIVTHSNEHPNHIIVCMTGLLHTRTVATILRQLKDENGECLFDPLQGYGLPETSDGFISKCMAAIKIARLTKMSTANPQYPGTAYTQEDIWRGIDECAKSNEEKSKLSDDDTSDFDPEFRGRIW